MRTAVAVYKGVEICRSKLVLCLPGAAPESLKDWYEATVDDWLIVGSLEGVQEQIDQRLKWDEASGKHKPI
jgi:hypothetical protein